MTKGSGWLFVKIIDSLERGTLTLGLMIRHIDGKSIFHVLDFTALLILRPHRGLNVSFFQLKHTSTFGFRAQPVM